MTQKGLKTTVIVASLVAMGILSFMPVSIWGKEKQPPQGEMSLVNVNYAHIPAVGKALGAVQKAIQSGNKEAALSALKQAKQNLMAVRKATCKQIQTLVINTKCPVSGDGFDLAKLTAKNVRPYQGKFVGFCCSDCPLEWDKFSDAKKAVKLAKIQATTSEKGLHDDHAGHNH